jgi:hypothetical protein
MHGMERFWKPLFAGRYLSFFTNNNTLLCEGHASCLASYMPTHAPTHTSVSCYATSPSPPPTGWTAQAITDRLGPYLAGLTATSRLHY